MADKYELQAARIEMVLGAHHVPARVWQAKVTPRFVRFDITTAMGTRLAKVNNLAEELAFSLGVRTCRVYREGGVLHVEIPRDNSRAVDLTEMCASLANVPPFCGVLGIEEGGAPLLVRLDSPDVAHLLLAGTTGSGKTALLRTLLLSLAMHNRPGMLQLALIDPKGRGFGPLGALPHVWRSAGVVRDTEAAGDMLDMLVAEMERRDQLNRSLPRIVVAIDELADLLQTGGKRIGDDLQRLTQRGREAGLHVVAATQRPSAAFVGGMVKANFPVRLVGAVVSAEDAKVASGIAGSNAEKLLGRGDFLLVAKGQVIRFQAAYADGRELAGIVGQVRAGGRRTRKWRPGQQVSETLEPLRISPDRLPPVPVRDAGGSGACTGAPSGAPPSPAHTYTNSLPVDDSRMRALVVHHPAPPVHFGANGAQSNPTLSPVPSDDGAPPSAPLAGQVAGSPIASPALSDEQSNPAERGALPRRPEGPNSADVKAIHDAYALFGGSLNKTCKWAYGSKGPLTMFWIKKALGESPEEEEDGHRTDDTENSQPPDAEPPEFFRRLRSDDAAASSER